MKYDVISFGDLTTDTFIKLINAHEVCDVNHEKCEICMPFGTKIPFESATDVAAVGNAPNASVAMARLGLSSALVAHLGKDEIGDMSIKALQERGVSTEFVRMHDDLPSNHHYVMQFGAERTILIKHAVYPFAFPAIPEAPQWFYLSSLPLDTLQYQLDIAAYARANNVKLAFQPGTYQMELGVKKLKPVYEASEIFFCNKEEAQLILNMPEEHDIKKLLEGVRALGPKIPVVTDGRNGSYILDHTGAYHVPMYPDPAPPVSRTGAGDATASTTVAYIIKGMEPKDALMRGVINAAAGVQAIHAQLGTMDAAGVEDWYAKRPADFVATAL